LTLLYCTGRWDRGEFDSSTFITSQVRFVWFLSHPLSLVLPSHPTRRCKIDPLSWLLGGNSREAAITSCRKRIEIVANALGLEGFARIDAFVHADTGEVIIIEANTVPGMTPSTVLIHQALAETPPIYPRMFFRKVVDLALSRHQQQ
jgi:hypothetical protein